MEYQDCQQWSSSINSVSSPISSSVYHYRPNATQIKATHLQLSGHSRHRSTYYYRYHNLLTFSSANCPVLGLFSPGAIRMSCEKCRMHTHLTRCHSAHPDVVRIIRNLKHISSPWDGSCFRKLRPLSILKSYPSIESHYLLVPQGDCSFCCSFFHSVIAWRVHLLSKWFVCLSPSLECEFLRLLHAPLEAFHRMLGIEGNGMSAALWESCDERKEHQTEHWDIRVSVWIVPN